MFETLDYTIRIGSTPTILYFDLYLYSAYAAHYVYFLLKALMYSVISVATLFIYTHLLTASAAFKTNIKKAVVVAWPLSVELYADIFGLHYIYTYIYTNIQTLKQLAKTENRRY